MADTKAKTKNPRLPRQKYFVRWVWADSPTNVHWDFVEATTVPRAIAKLTRQVGQEYANASTDMRFLEVSPESPLK